eukprot:4914688-Prymnesium_polylepis.3
MTVSSSERKALRFALPRLTTPPLPSSALHSGSTRYDPEKAICHCVHDSSYPMATTRRSRRATTAASKVVHIRYWYSPGAFSRDRGNHSTRSTVSITVDSV